MDFAADNQNSDPSGVPASKMGGAKTVESGSVTKR